MYSGCSVEQEETRKIDIMQVSRVKSLCVYYVYLHLDLEIHVLLEHRMQCVVKAVSGVLSPECSSLSSATEISAGQAHACANVNAEINGQGSNK